MIQRTNYNSFHPNQNRVNAIFGIVSVLFIPPVPNLSCYPSRIVDFQEGMRGGSSRKTLNRSEECKGDTAWEEEQDIMSGLSFQTED